MKISKDKVVTLGNVIRSIEDEPTVQQAEDGSELRSWALADTAITLHRRTADSKFQFLGLSFQAFGQQFYVTDDLEVSFMLLDDNEEVKTYLVTDESLVADLESFLEWRTSAAKHQEF